MVAAITTPSVTINNETISVVPNSISYDEGLGEQTVRVQSAGAGSVQTVFSQDVTLRKSTVKFSMYPTKENISSLREWKIAEDANAILITDSNSGFTKTFLQAALTSNYEIKLGSDDQIDVEFCTQSAIGN